MTPARRGVPAGRSRHFGPASTAVGPRHIRVRECVRPPSGVRQAYDIWLRCGRVGGGRRGERSTPGERQERVQQIDGTRLRHAETLEHPGCTSVAPPARRTRSGSVGAGRTFSRCSAELRVGLVRDLAGPGCGGRRTACQFAGRGDPLLGPPWEGEVLPVVRLVAAHGARRGGHQTGDVAVRAEPRPPAGCRG